MPVNIPSTTACCMPGPLRTFSGWVTRRRSPALSLRAAGFDAGTRSSMPPDREVPANCGELN
ncbi:hypothetical protein GCM10028800_16140 [Nesterenkonia populi]